jgi:hypothetical protein
MTTNLDLTDMETCYKAFRREVIQSIRLNSNRFGFEPEVTAKVAKRGYRIFEVPISYYGRDYWEGKKINWKDGFSAIWTILRYGLFNDDKSEPSTFTTLRRRCGTTAGSGIRCVRTSVSACSRWARGRGR